MRNKIYELYALEQLAAGNSCVHRLNPLVKLLAAMVFIITVVSFNRFAFGRLIPFVFYPAILMALSQTPYSMLNKRFLAALPFCLFVGISNLIFDRSTAFAVGGIMLSWGVVSFAVILFRTWLCVMAVLILVSVTPLSALTNELRRLRLPKIFIVMFELTYRYTGVLLNEAYSAWLAYSLRSPNTKGIKMRDMGSFTGILLIRSFDRAERVYDAMKCRGYASDYAFQNTPQNKKPSINDFIFLFTVCLLCATFRLVDVNSFFAVILGRFVQC
ncbi:cobalt ECF transporter T component CbiQ [Treponema sp. R80B11-R83G3]